MPTEPLTISNLTEIGLVVDTPAVSLPPNVFSDVQNVRFRDGAVQKFPGETDRFTSTGIDYVAFWPAPSGDKYVVIRGTTLQILNASYSNVSYTNPESISISDSSNWQHTLFNGFSLLINAAGQRSVVISRRYHISGWPPHKLIIRPSAPTPPPGAREAVLCHREAEHDGPA